MTLKRFAYFMCYCIFIINKNCFHFTHFYLELFLFCSHGYGKKLKKWWSTIPKIATKRIATSHLKPLNIKRSTTYDVGNSCSGLGQAHICGRVKPVIGSQSSPPDNLIFNDNTDTNNDEQHSKTGKDDWQHKQWQYNNRHTITKMTDNINSDSTKTGILSQRWLTT